MMLHASLAVWVLIDKSGPYRQTYVPELILTLTLLKS